MTDMAWMIYFGLLGACVGSFLNVVVFRLPREMSVLFPGSHCPNCRTPIRFYDNIPLISYLLLRGKCRQCDTLISPRYFVVELSTGILFAFLFWVYFSVHVRDDIVGFSQQWPTYLLHVALLSALLAASLIDAELFIIPLAIPWVIAVVGLIGNPLAALRTPLCVPEATAQLAAAALGATIGLIIANLLLWRGIFKVSFENAPFPVELPDGKGEKQKIKPDPSFSARREIIKEIIFLTPPILLAFAALRLLPDLTIWKQWLDITWVNAFFGSLLGLLVGGGIVWAVRILGTLGFGREAMGLGDAHLMAGVGAVLGGPTTVIAFFLAPFFGLSWGMAGLILRRQRELPYGPHLAAATLLAMIFYDRFLGYFVGP